MMLVSIDEGSRQPIYLQIVCQVKEQILVGELMPGNELPSIRDLGNSLGISLHTARSAYQVLAEEGLLRVRLGKKARVAALATEAIASSFGDEYSLRVREFVVDGLLQGCSAEELHQILDREIAVMSQRGALLKPTHSGKELT